MKTFISTFLISFILISLIFCQENSNNQHYILKGKIIGQNSGEVILKYVVSYQYKIDTAILNNGEFIFEGNISEPKAADIIMGNDLNTAHIYIEPGEMKIILTKDKFSEFKMNGSKTQDEANEYNLLISNIIKQKKHENESNETTLKFIYSHPKSYLSVDLLWAFDLNEIISLDSLKSIYNMFDTNIQNSTKGKEIKKDIIKKENIAIGATAPDFKATDINNQLVTLSEFKGKSVVLLDFWASNCVYCRKSFPHLKEVYRKNHSKGLEIICVSQDLNKKNWLSAINHDSIAIWHHVLIANNYPCNPSQMTKDDIYENYFIQSIPLQLLIDKSGKIIGKWNGYSKENVELLDNQLAKIFKEN